MTESIPLSAADVQARLLQGPYHQWLGLEVTALGKGEIELTARWREEWVVNSAGGYTHGGILAALIDLTADWALVFFTGRGVPTLNLHVDYHRPARGDLTARGRVIKTGKQVSCAEAELYDGEGRLVASGRGLYATPAA
ncbi:phenylacetic acid degradation protein [Brenneria goodwinii]|uniref:Phenylacetic acid degradation protein n=1 Tax=Brenneria goodwinii TaxID=1109412 RepID=A0AAE8JLW9_9GAMM|nr:PaaI family thioesterase [Brenneria goodwinii]ATA23421.1 phenylacetic acid degradation protein [Brenneria goodwinii]RLM17234.1 phenylacetic acid degradation protein [Brenneria goodwinii]